VVYDRAWDSFVLAHRRTRYVAPWIHRTRSYRLKDEKLSNFCFDISAFASLYLKTLPHTSIDATVWVWSWIASEQKMTRNDGGCTQSSPFLHFLSCESVEWVVSVDHFNTYQVKSVVVPIQGESIEQICWK
jgi:hypothetical protein